MKRIAFYGGSFDPVHIGHLKIADEVTRLFALDRFDFVPAFRAPHKRGEKPSSAYHRFAMLSIATIDRPKQRISTIELDTPEKPYTIETLERLVKENPDDEIFFVIGSDSWQEITTWRDWERVLKMVNIIVISRPGYPLTLTQVTEEIRDRVIDLRNDLRNRKDEDHPILGSKSCDKIFITDCVKMDISSTQIRNSIHARDKDWARLLPKKVADYIEKYDLFVD